MDNIENTQTIIDALGEENKWVLEIMETVRNRVDIFFESAKFIDEELIQQIKLSLCYNILSLIKKNFTSFLRHSPTKIELKKKELSNHITIYLASSGNYKKYFDKKAEWFLSQIKEIKENIEDKKSITIKTDSVIVSTKQIKRTNTNKGRKHTHIFTKDKYTLQSAIKNIPNYLELSQNKLANELCLSPSYFSELLTKFDIIVKDI